MKLRISSITALALVLGFAAADDGYAQEYPAKAIRLIISSSPGSGVDTIARAVAQRMSEALSVQIIPDNRAGGGGTDRRAGRSQSAGDGYTLLMGAPSFTVNATLVKPPPYEFPRDFAAIGQATTAPYIVVVHPALPVKSVKELIALAKARPGQLNFGSGGTGNSTHLTGEYFEHLTQTNIVHVPYKGSGPAVVDLLGGHIQLMFANLVAVLPNVKSGKLRGLTSLMRIRPDGADRYDALWLYLARARSGRVDPAEKRWEGAEQGLAWPACPILYYGGCWRMRCGRLPASKDATLDRNQRCEADFYIGERRLAQGDQAAARRPLERALGECPHSFIEYEMAPVELKRLLTKAALVQQPSAQ